jgi:hypothetical protein
MELGEMAFRDEASSEQTTENRRRGWHIWRFIPRNTRDGAEVALRSEAKQRADSRQQEARAFLRVWGRRRG